MNTTYRVAFLAILLGVADTSLGVTINMTSGTTGTTQLNQSFNETRGVTATLLGSTDYSLLLMRLDGFNIGLPPGGTVGARLYSNTGTLIASADSSVPTGFVQSVTIPISATLTAGSAYRFAFFISNGDNGGSGDIFDPDPPNVFGFSYVESNGLFQLTDAWSIPGDSFPTNPNTSVPLMFLEVQAVPEPALLWLVLAGLTALAMVVRKQQRAAVKERVAAGV